MPKEQTIHAFVAEDDADLREMVADLLLDKGWKVSLYHNADLLFRHLEGSHCDIVVTDHNMPGMTGLELLQKLRQDARYAKLPVVVLTSARIEKEVGASGGVYAYKSGDVGILYAAVDKALAAT